MTPKTLWTILLKVIGLSILIDAFNVLPQSVSVIISAGQMSSYEGTSNAFFTVGLTLLTVIIYILIIRLFLFKTDWLIWKLSLDKHFDEDQIALNIQGSTIIQISIIVIGGLIIVDGFPSLCRQVFSFYQQTSIFRNSPTSEWLIFYALKTTVGYLLMTNSGRLTDLVEKKQKE